MMHGHEKSDSAIVAVKPTNKALHSAAEQSTAELFAAEPVEPRAETKRNAGQQSTCGTQGQISVSHGNVEGGALEPVALRLGRDADHGDSAGAPSRPRLRLLGCRFASASYTS